MQVYILYLTTKCNLKCPYCYENQKITKINKQILYQDIDSFLSKILYEEPNNPSTLCLLGGEPLLEMDKILYIYRKCLELKTNYNKIITINTITNGTLINKYLKDWKYMINSNKVYMSLDVSYDGRFQYVRTRNNDIVKKNLKILNQEKIPFGISYTISTHNFELDTLFEELVTILEEFYPDKEYNKLDNNKKKIRLNFDSEKVENIIGKSIQEYKKDITERLDYLFLKYHIPFCELNCHVCKRCNRQDFTGKTYVTPSNKIIQEPMISYQKFNHFS